MRTPTLLGFCVALSAPLICDAPKPPKPPILLPRPPMATPDQVKAALHAVGLGNSRVAPTGHRVTPDHPVAGPLVIESFQKAEWVYCKSKLLPPQAKLLGDGGSIALELTLSGKKNYLLDIEVNPGFNGRAWVAFTGLTVQGSGTAHVLVPVLASQLPASSSSAMVFVSGPGPIPGTPWTFFSATVTELN